MNNLNGWQRIWVVLMALWAAPVVFFALQSLPRYDGRGWFGQPDPDVSKYMPTPAWWGSDCKGNELKPVNRRFRDGRTQEWNGERWRVVPFREIASELRRDHPDVYAGLSDDKVKAKLDDDWIDLDVQPLPFDPDEYVEFVRAGVPSSDANIALCFDTRISDAEMNRVLGEYATVYKSAWWCAVAAHAGTAVLVWLVPGVALYALGWSVGWIRRGFDKEARGVVNPTTSAPTRILIVVVGWIAVAWALLIVVSNAISLEPRPWLPTLGAALITAAYGLTLIQRNRRAVSFTWIMVVLFGAAVIFGGLVPVAILVWGLLLAFALVIRKYQSELRA